jgi:hypothetical protein
MDNYEDKQEGQAPINANLPHPAWSAGANVDLDFH